VGNARLIVNGGAVTVGSWGLNIGTGNEWGYGHGTINIYSGTIEAQNLSFGTYTNGLLYAGGSGTINIFGGKITADSITHLDTSGCLINIEDGKLCVDGDVRSQVDNWVAGGYMTAYNGTGTIARSYNTTRPNKADSCNSHRSGKICGYKMVGPFPANRRIRQPASRPRPPRKYRHERRSAGSRLGALRSKNHGKRFENDSFP